MKLDIRAQKSKVPFENGLVISSHFTGLVITYPCWDWKLKIDITERGPFVCMVICKLYVKLLSKTDSHFYTIPPSLFCIFYSSHAILYPNYKNSLFCNICTGIHEKGTKSCWHFVTLLYELPDSLPIPGLKVLLQSCQLLLWLHAPVNL